MAENPVTGEPEWMGLGRLLAEEIRTRRKAAGLSHPRLAERVGYTRQYVSLAERPKKGLPSASLVQGIDEALDAGGALVALRDQADAARKACRPGASASTVVDEVTTMGSGPGTSSDRAEVRNAKRRELITSAAAITFGDSLDEPVGQILAVADEPQVPARVRAGDVQQLRSAWETLRADIAARGGGAVRHQAVAALRWATALLGSSSTPAVRQELAVMTAKVADTAAWATFDAGRHEPARQLSLLGLHAARESGDLGMRACVASGLARREIYRGNWAGGLELTQLAFTAGDALTPNAVVDLHTVNALACARKRDTAQCRRHMGAATDAYRPDSASNDPFWLNFTSAQLERDLAFARYDLVVGGAVGENTAERVALIEGITSAFRQYPADWVLFKAIIAARLATLFCLEGEQHVAHQRVEDAIALAGQVRSARLADDLRVLLRVLRPGGSADEYARDLRQRLSAVLT
ncbi:MAG: helix-turn-helix domain-containing protein, partial [Pseudonocardiaceae bacterium]